MNPRDVYACTDCKRTFSVGAELDADSQMLSIYRLATMQILDLLRHIVELAWTVTTHSDDLGVDVTLIEDKNQTYIAAVLIIAWLRISERETGSEFGIRRSKPFLFKELQFRLIQELKTGYPGVFTKEDYEKIIAMIQAVTISGTLKKINKDYLT